MACSTSHCCFMHDLVLWWVVQLEMDVSLSNRRFSESWAYLIVKKTISRHIKEGCSGDCVSIIPPTYRDHVTST